MNFLKIKIKKLKNYSLKTISLLLILGIVVGAVPIKPVVVKAEDAPQGEITTYTEETAEWLNGEVESSNPGLLETISNAFNTKEGGLISTLGEAAWEILKWLAEKLWHAVLTGADKGLDILKEVGVITAKNMVNQTVNSLYSGALREFENAYLIQDYKKLADDVAYRAVYTFNNMLLYNDYTGLAGQQLPVAVISAIKDFETKMQGKIAKELYNQGYELTTNTLKYLGIAINPQQNTYVGKKRYFLDLVKQSRENPYTLALAIIDNNNSLKTQADRDAERQKTAGVMDDTGDNTSQSIETVVLGKNSVLDPELLEGTLKELEYAQIELVPLASDSGKYKLFKGNDNLNYFYLTPPNLKGEVVYLVVDNQGTVKELSTYTSDIAMRQTKDSVALSPMVNNRTKQSEWNGLVKHPAAWVKDQIVNLNNTLSSNIVNDDGKTVDYIQSTLANVLSSMVRFDFGVTRDKDGCPTGITGKTIWSETGELQPLTPPVNRYKCITKHFGWLFSPLAGLACKILNFLYIGGGICTGEDIFGTNVVPTSPPTTAVEGIYNYDFFAGMDSVKEKIVFRVFGEKGGFAGKEDVTKHIMSNFGFNQISSDGQIIEGKQGPSTVSYGGGIPFEKGIGPDMNNLIYESPPILAGRGAHSLHWPGWDRRVGRLVGEQRFWLFLYFFKDNEPEEGSGYPVAWRDEVTFGSMPTMQTDLYATMVKSASSVVRSPGPNFVETDLTYRTIAYGTNFNIEAAVEDLAKKINPGDDTVVNYWARIHKIGDFPGSENPLISPNIPQDLKDKIMESMSTKVVVPAQIDGNGTPETLTVVNGGKVELSLGTFNVNNIPYQGIYLLSLDIDPMGDAPEMSTYNPNNSAYMIINVEPQK